MKKFFTLALTLTLFSGCFWNKDDKVVLSEDPQIAFDQLTANHREAWKNVVLDMIPEVDSFEKAKKLFTFKASAFIAELGGDLNINLTAESATDASNPENPNMRSLITLAGDLKGLSFSGNAKAVLEMIIANASIFAQIKEISVDVPHIPTSEIMAPIQPYLGKWYGDRFDTLDEAIGNNLNFQKVLAQEAMGQAEVRKKIGDMIATTQLFTMTSRLPDENGFAVFEVKIDKEALKKALTDLVEIGNPSDERMAEVKADLDQKIAGRELSGKLGILMENPKYYTFSGILRNTGEESKDVQITISFLEDNKTITASGIDKNTEHATLEIMSEKGIDTFRLYGGKTAEENNNFLVGKKSDSSFEGAFSNPDLNEEVAKIMLEKKENVWTGTVTNPEKPDFVVMIDRLFFDRTSFSLGISVKNKETQLGSGSIEYSVEEVSSVDISAPESYEPFGPLLENFLPMMSFGAQGVAGEELPPGMELPPTPEGMSDEELNAMIEEAMKKQEEFGDTGNETSEIDSL